MKTLKRLFDVAFDTARIGLDRLIAFTTDHLQRMIANNPGALLNTRINATNAALSALDVCVTDDLGKLGLRKARVDVKDTFRASLPIHLAKIHAAVVAKYGPEAPQVTECFPQGRTVFTHCRDDAVENHLQILVTHLAPYVAEMGPQAHADAAGLLSTWLGTYSACESSTGAKTATEAGKRAARLNLQLELHKNVLTLAMEFARQPEKCALYLRQDLLETHPPETTGEEEAPAAAV